MQNSLSTSQVFLTENVEELFSIVSQDTLQQVNILFTSLSTQLVPIISQVQRKLQDNIIEEPNLTFERNTNKIDKNTKPLQQDTISIIESLTDQRIELQTLPIVDDKDIAQNIIKTDVEEPILIEKPSIATTECKKANETLLNASINKNLETVVKSEILETESPDSNIKPDLVIGSEITEIAKEELERLTLIETVTQEATKILLHEDSANSCLVTSTSTPTIFNDISKDETPDAENINSGFIESSNISKELVDVLEGTNLANLRSESQKVEKLTEKILDLNVIDNSLATIEPETTVRSEDINKSVKSDVDNFVQVMTKETVLLAVLDGEAISEATEVIVMESDTGRTLSDTMVSVEPDTLKFPVKITFDNTQEEIITTKHNEENIFVNNICDNFSSIDILQDESSEIKNMRNLALYEEPDNVLEEEESEPINNIETSTTVSIEEITSSKTDLSLDKIVEIISKTENSTTLAPNEAEAAVIETVHFIIDNIETTSSIIDGDKQSIEQILAADSILTNTIVESTSPIALEKVKDCQEDATEKDSQLTDLVKESVSILLDKNELNDGPPQHDISRDVQVDAQVSEPEQTHILQDLSLCQQEASITESDKRKTKAKDFFSVENPIQAIEISGILPKDPSKELPKTIIGKQNKCFNAVVLLML